MKKNQLNDRCWKIFQINEIFNEIYISYSNDLGKLSIGTTPCIGRTALNNGFQGEYHIVDNKKINKGNCITVSMVGDFKAFYQSFDFACSQNILILRDYKTKINNKTIQCVLTKHMSLFLITTINDQLSIYAYGYPISLKRFRKQNICLPINNDNMPDYIFMGEYIKEKIREKENRYISFKTKQYMVDNHENVVM